MKQEQAKERIIAEFHSWASQQKNPAERNGFVFFNHLEMNRPDLLNFKCSGDKWQRVHGWLLNARFVGG